ncbi:PREDICTED: calcyphosin-2-like [Tauraco erythrolophus]|uniref:calcyphosin-2-like n=1 Tax=Tauraco erythrolophus TaxID=121530 RepID=UPI0005236153|nr:PREDICTED: calcyphosin-2-like [Tauraco erythrolophus]
MDLEVKGVAASPQRQAQLSSRGKKCQGWRADTWAARGPRPPEVPCLDLRRLGDSDEEDGDSYIPYSGNNPHTCPLNSSSDWRTSLQTPYAQHHQAQQVKKWQNMKNSMKIKPEYAVIFAFFLTVKHSVKKFQKLHWKGIIIMLFPFNRSTRGFYIDYSLLYHSVLEQKTIPENLPFPTDRYKLKYRQYEADMKEEYKQYSQRIAEKKKDHLQCPKASIKYQSDTIMSSVFQGLTPLNAVLQAYQKGVYRSSQVNPKRKK